MAPRSSIAGISSPEQLRQALIGAQYIADMELSTAGYLALALGKPLLLEGAPGVGKTEAAKAIGAVLGRRVVRLQCFEGIDASAALYEWNYTAQMLAIRQAGNDYVNIYSDNFLLQRPMLEALRNPEDCVLLIDEVDRADHEFEAFLLEFLSDFTISIPETGTIRATSRPVVFLVALVVVLAAIVEWMVQAWSERASDDTGYNATIRGRLLHPLEFPVLATLGLGALIYGFSRIMLSASKDAGRWLFIAIGALFLAGAVVVAIYRGAGKRTIAGVSALAAFAVVGVGVASAVQGQRDIEAHPAPSCLSNEEGEGDHGAPKAPSDTAGVYATIVLTDSDFYAVLGNWNGPDKIAYHQLSVPRNARVSLVFLNQTSEPARLTARLGKFGDAAESVECTAMVEADGEGYLSIKAVNVPLASTEPMQLQLGGEEAPAIEIQVP